MDVAEIKQNALALPSSERVSLAIALMGSLPDVLEEEDNARLHAAIRDIEMDLNPDACCSLEDIVSSIDRERQR